VANLREALRHLVKEKNVKHCDCAATGWEVGKARLLLLAEFLEHLPPDKFDGGRDLGADDHGRRSAESYLLDVFPGLVRCTGPGEDREPRDETHPGACLCGQHGACLGFGDEVPCNLFGLFHFHGPAMNESLFLGYYMFIYGDEPGCAPLQDRYDNVRAAARIREVCADPVGLIARLREAVRA
jgi:hypothetical protein